MNDDVFASPETLVAALEACAGRKQRRMLALGRQRPDGVPASI
jgi:hypothetical protein